MALIFHKADSRGLAEHGWLTSRHTFSFANYYDPERVNFGALRVINDDIVAPGEGFPTHPHKNMEIISIPLAGALKHGDSMGHEQTIRAGEVQVMSAGRGLLHSEFNASQCEAVAFLQIWIVPMSADVDPRYDQHDFSGQFPEHGVLAMIGPHGAGLPLGIQQNAFVSMACLAGGELTCAKHIESNGIYFFVLEGSVVIAGQELAARDGLGVTDLDPVCLRAESAARVLCLEVPLQ